MDRLGKGNDIHSHVDDYVVVDLETTGTNVLADRIIEISAIKIRNNSIVDEFSTLVNPEIHIPEQASRVNNITDDMVEDAPVLSEVIDSFLEFVGNDVILGYNNASFDMNMIFDSVSHLRNATFSNDYLDILYCARRVLSDVENHKLETLCKYFGIDNSEEHRALVDCRLTKMVYDRLYEKYGDAFFSCRSASKSSGEKRLLSEDSLALRELQCLLDSVTEDGIITPEELCGIRDWMDKHCSLRGNYPYDHIYDALAKVLEDGMVTDDELEELNRVFSETIDPVKSASGHSINGSICGMHFVITGEFEYGSRAEVTCFIEDKGGLIDNTVKKSTNYVIVGVKGSDHWQTGNYGSKIKKAMEYKENGIPIEIIEEKDFFNSIQGPLEKLDVNTTNWTDSIRDMLEDLIKEYELPVGSLYLSDNYSTKDETNRIISHSVCIWEPNYPQMPNEKRGQNKIVVTISLNKIKSNPRILEIIIRENQEGDLHDYLPNDAILIERTKSDFDTGSVRVRIDKDSPYLSNYIKVNTEYCIKGYVSKAGRFACCSSFEKCSDAMKCVHENKLYSKACMYRDNLDAGRIFYGINRNVD